MSIVRREHGKDDGMISCGEVVIITDLAYTPVVEARGITAE